MTLYDTNEAKLIYFRSGLDNTTTKNERFRSSTLSCLAVDIDAARGQTVLTRVQKALESYRFVARRQRSLMNYCACDCLFYLWTLNHLWPVLLCKTEAIIIQEVTTGY